MLFKLPDCSGLGKRLPLKEPVFYLLMTYVTLAIFLVIAVLQTRVPVGNLIRDPASITYTPSYTGFFSNLGVLLWCATTTLCLFSSLLLGRANRQRRLFLFLLYSGLLSLLFTLDDLYLLHERFFPKLFHLPEKVVLIMYGITVCVYLIKFRRTIFRTGSRSLMGLALGMFFVSVSVDLLPPGLINLPDQTIMIVENGPKLFGIASWLGYFLTVCSHIPDWIVATQQPQSIKNHQG